MHLHDPERPLIGARPGFRHVGIAIPQLCLFPLANGQIQAGMMLPIEWNLSQWHMIVLDPGSIPELLAELNTDPELCLEKRFGWTTPTAIPEIILED